MQQVNSSRRAPYLLDVFFQFDVRSMFSVSDAAEGRSFQVSLLQFADGSNHKRSVEECKPLTRAPKRLQKNKKTRNPGPMQYLFFITLMQTLSAVRSDMRLESIVYPEASCFTVTPVPLTMCLSSGSFLTLPSPASFVAASFFAFSLPIRSTNSCTLEGRMPPALGQYSATNLLKFGQLTQSSHAKAKMRTKDRVQTSLAFPQSLPCSSTPS